MPYFNNIQNLKVISVIEKEDKNRLNEIKKNRYLPCIKCRKNEYARLYCEIITDKFFYVGYLCKNCKTAFFLNTRQFSLKRRNEDDFIPEYVGSFATQLGFPSEPEYLDFRGRIRKKRSCKT